MSIFAFNQHTSKNSIETRKRFAGFITFAISLALLTSAPASAAVESVPSQIISTSTTWGGNSNSYKIEGLIQIPQNVTLNITSAALLDMSNGSFLVLGNLNIIGSDSMPTEIIAGKGILDSRSAGQSLSIAHSRIVGNGWGLLSSERLMNSVSILNSTISGFRYIASSGSASSMTFSGNTVINTAAFYSSGFQFIYSVKITDNAFYELRSIGGETPGIYVNVGQAGPSYIFSGNYFENRSSTLNLIVPKNDSYKLVIANQNFFETPSKVVLEPFGKSFSQNYWNGVSSETELRSQAKIIDGKSDITKPVITLEPLLVTPPTAQPSLTRLRAFLQSEITAKAAADKAAADKAAADKAAADKAAADKAAADKAAADKAAADKAAADKAAADKAAADKAAADKAAADAKKKSTITCVKGKLTKKVTAVKPKCPSGYKKK